MDSAIKTLVDRLECVTARLEKVEKHFGGAGSCPAPCAKGGAAASSGGAQSAAGAQYVAEFDTLVADNIPKFVAASQKIGNDELKKQVAAFERAVKALRQVIQTASTSKKPDEASLPQIMKEVGAVVQEVVDIRDKARGNALWNHLSALSEFAPGFGWVSVEPTPGPFLKEFVGNSQFYSNKLIREFKGKDATQMEWLDSLGEFQKGLLEYIRKYHTTGLAWNSSGGSASASAGSAPTAASSTPNPTEETKKAAPKLGGGGAPGGLFAELTKGEAVTSGLKKVSKDQMTHKNPALRGSSVVPAEEKKGAAPRATSAANVKKGTPKIELSGNKWSVDWQENNKNIVISDTEVKHTVYIYKCEGSVIQIKGKVNAITIDNCKKCGVVFENAVASVELVNCTSVEVQALGKVPSFAIDKSQSVQLILSKDCLDAEIVSAKSDQMNVLIPGPKEGDDPVEMPIPEQFKTVVRNGKLVTEHVEHC